MGNPTTGWFKVYFMENPVKVDDDWGYPYDSGNPHRDKYGGLIIQGF